MYPALLFLHSVFRWLVVISLLLAISKAYLGYARKTSFTRSDNLVRHWTATIAHVQLMIGMLLYFQSALVKHFWKGGGHRSFEFTFYSLVHSLGMLCAIIVLTIGSAKAKRKMEASEKFRTMLTWYVAALLIILLAIPWPFSPLAQRPFFRSL